MLSIDNERCIQCGTCVDECTTGALKNEDGMIRHDPSKCMWCGHCLAVCPRDCIIIDGDGYDCEEVEEISFGKAPTAAQIRNMILIRRSIRAYDDEPVTEDELGNILEAGKYSPTARNRQGNAFVAVTEEMTGELAQDTVKAFRRLAAQGKPDERFAGMANGLCDAFENEGLDKIYFSAPLVIFVFADSEIDGAICATNMGWMAQAQQLGYCFARIPIAAFNDPEFSAKWKAPEGKKPVIALLIGNPANEYFCSVPRKTPEITIF